MLINGDETGSLREDGMRSDCTRLEPIVEEFFQTDARVERGIISPRLRNGGDSFARDAAPSGFALTNGVQR